jgi:tetratricopeptide (TPR) repeat protein
MDAGRAVWVGLFALVISLGWVGEASSQERWSWPEKPENLQVLPKDFTGQRLRPVMTGFTRALGVRCSYCHVGEEGQPLSSYDFASDDNPNKDRAREMLRMLKSINDHLQKIEPSGPERVNMWCHTCHAGRPRPMTLGEELTEAYTEGGVDGAIGRYRELRERYDDRGAYDFGETSLNRFGYHLLEEGDADGAIAIFRLNVERFPESANVYDSLAEGYLSGGQRELAEIFYRKSLELDPDNDNALKKLRELAGDGEGPTEEGSESGP